MTDKTLEADDMYLTTLEAAAFLRLSKGWFDVAACRGTGVPFTKAGGKRLYKKADLIEWLERRKVSSTSEYQLLKEKGFLK